jgi:hypothetical protein
VKIEQARERDRFTALLLKPAAMIGVGLIRIVISLKKTDTLGGDLLNLDANRLSVRQHRRLLDLARPW